jgi:choline dehydrogenase
MVIRGEYDYVIVGGGSAGCAVAARLAASAPDASVLVIEAGPDGRGVTQIVDPPLWPRLLGSSLDWGYWYAPSPAVAGRAIAVPRGKVLGGSSAINAMQWYRGDPAGYDAWEAAGAAGWSYASLLPYFRRSEDWEGGASEHRGAGGPLRVTRSRRPHPIALAMVDGAAELGLPRLDDPNSGDTWGAALANLNVSRGRRFSVVDGYLPAWAPPAAPGQVPVGAWLPAPPPPPNLTVTTGSLALRLGFDRPGTDGSRCTSVVHLVHGAMLETRAAREVILALGAFGTPELLIRSGIGDPAALRRLGVPVVSALAGVGQNLQDHPFVAGVHFRASQRLGLPRAGAGGAIINWRSRAAPHPDLHAFVVQGTQAAPHEAIRDGLSTGDVFAISPALMGSRSTGSLSVCSVAQAGPRAVEIRSGLLTEQADVDALVEAVDFIADLAGTRAYADLIDKPLTPAAGPGRLSRAEKVAFVREHCSTLFHPCGTAAMGAGPDAVVDPSLSVYGVCGLRVADASVIPVIPACNIQAPVVAIAERAADLILSA